MNEEQYLSTTRIWFGPSRQIQALDDKRMIIVHAESETDAQLHICGADPDGPDAGKVCVKAMSIYIEDLEWTDAGQPLKTTVLRPP